MFKIIDTKGNKFNLYNYRTEKEFEKMIIENIDSILGSQGIYFDIKKKIGPKNIRGTIPDGYYLDLMFHQEPQLYLVEVEMENHDVYSHIGQQILKFSISSEMDKHKIT